MSEESFNDLKEAALSAEQKTRLLRDALIGLVGESEERELRNMRTVLDLIPDSESEKSVMVNAINALIACQEES